MAVPVFACLAAPVSLRRDARLLEFSFASSASPDLE